VGREHNYQVDVRWTGNTGTGTSGYRGYGREHDIVAAGKPMIQGSADPTFRGTPDRWNPEELLVASLSQCHMLSYLSLCARDGVLVTDYQDSARGVMETAGGGGHFTEVVLHPVVVVTDASMAEKAAALHHEAHEVCFVASSVNFPVRHEPSIQVRTPESG
jgi:organic hydroperoxide reductase OsmC/OhrA